MASRNTRERPAPSGAVAPRVTAVIVLGRPDCDLCAEDCDPDDWCDAAGLFVCPQCMEDSL
jgi:hypothetical protein